MKIQDIIGIVVAVLFLMKYKNPMYSARAGILCLIMAIPLFGMWIFFTAERLVLYAALYLLLSLLFSIRTQNQVQ